MNFDLILDHNLFVADSGSLGVSRFWQIILFNFKPFIIYVCLALRLKSGFGIPVPTTRCVRSDWKKDCSLKGFRVQ